jgi:hypothetical protein
MYDQTKSESNLVLQSLRRFNLTKIAFVSGEVVVSVVATGAIVVQLLAKDFSGATRTATGLIINTQIASRTYQFL